MTAFDPKRTFGYCYNFYALQLYLHFLIKVSFLINRQEWEFPIVSEDVSARILVIEFWIFIVPLSLLYFFGLFWTIGGGFYFYQFALPLVVHGLALASAWRVIIEFSSEGRNGLRYLSKWWYFFPCVSGLCVLIATIVYIALYSDHIVDIEKESFLTAIAFTSIFGLIAMPPFIHILIETYNEYR